ncbi:MAG: tyrosine-type recombinase/integrase, partial [Kiloniellales bacterium]
MGPFGRGETGTERQITRSLVWRLRHGEVIWDSELQGFGIAAGDDGKLYFLETAIGGERRRTVIGRHGEPWTPETARSEAWRLKAELLRAADAGGDRGRGARRRRRLTSAVVEGLKPGEIAWDREVTGFGARCQRVTKVYFLKARIGRRQRWITIGTHGAEWQPDGARREAQRLLAEIAAGGGPAAAPPPRRNITLAELCDRYLKEGCGAKRASTLATDRGRIERHIKPLLGGKRIAGVTSADIEGFAAAVTAGETATDVRTRPRGRAIVTGGAGTAARTLGLLSAIFGFAVKRGLIERNPVRGVRRAAPHRTLQPPSAGELERLGGALVSAELEGADPGAVAALRLMVLTGCRSAELLALTWADVDLDRASLRLRDNSAKGSGGGQRFVALSVQASVLLRGLPRGAADTPVLPGQSRTGRLPALAP